jgi:hypothetical protein
LAAQVIQRLLLRSSQLRQIIKEENSTEIKCACSPCCASCGCSSQPVLCRLRLRGPKSVLPGLKNLSFFYMRTLVNLHHILNNLDGKEVVSPADPCSLLTFARLLLQNSNDDSVATTGALDKAAY